MRTAKCREEIIQRVLIGEVDDFDTRTPLIAIAVKDIVMPDGQVKKIAGRDARRIMVVVFRSRSRNAH